MLGEPSAAQCPGCHWLLLLLALALSPCASCLASEPLRFPVSPSPTLDLPVLTSLASYPPYAAFCRRTPDECDLTGEATFHPDAETLRDVMTINAEINREIYFVLDIEQYGEEEYWTLPLAGRGDCEDLALLKRQRLSRLGVPRGSMRLALVFHATLLSSHCVLTLETGSGTYVLDNLTDELKLWHRTEYNFELRERPDGAWDRFDQRYWR